ncbi:hypothetical protein PR202_ga11012 [Eleusine coracana subsp. coracana]|uniref:Uncharacterized protein n=1 Tax=Eleusine coracana subsp. coracana TaxID=191504 RepID=A0AAV5C7Y9_ELECO|nr:hypothetical protein PR202_ga11012 [Eleusine coracana subsp. coracana]
MDSSCDLESAPGVISKGISPAGSVSTDIPLVLEKHRASVDETGEAAESSLEDQICMDFSKSISLGTKKGFQKSATFPASAGEAEHDDGLSCLADEVMKDAPAYERSMSLPPTLKLISAMKGSRQKNGMSLTTENRRVKWAPDVYDPPVTSVCHSVNSSYHYQRRSKSRKEKNKKEKNKEKSKQKKKQKTKSKKGHQNSSVLQTPDLGYVPAFYLYNSWARAYEILLLCAPLKLVRLEDVSTSHGLGKHEAVILDYSIGKEACGSSFLRESVANMHFSTAEAS